MTESVVEAVSEATKPQPPVVMAPEDDIVELPIGLVTPTSVLNRVRVRELNGFDEEAIARSKTFGATVRTVLERAVVDIEGEKPTKALMKEMFLGDRMAVLVGISRCTWGKIVATTVYCSDCDETQEIEYDLDDMEVTKASPEDSYFSVKLSRGTARVHWPQGATHDAVLDMTDRTAADVRTALINTCVDEINDMPVFGDAAKRLSIKDRTTLVDKINEVYLGPRFDLSSAKCPNCGKEISPAVTLADLFPL